MSFSFLALFGICLIVGVQNQENLTTYFLDKRCAIVAASKSAKLIPEQIDNKVRDSAVRTLLDESSEPWYKTEDYKNRNTYIKNLVHERFPYRLCNDSIYAPSLEQLDEILSCENICRQCFPGSVSICLLRNLKFLSLGETCLCTYSMTNPIDGAAFSVRHEKRIFSRRF